MRKFVCFALILCLLPVMALADDLSSMSFDDLMALRQQITAEIMSRPEWKEVTVPSGAWKVGLDIPVGVYSIHPTEKGGYLRILSDSGKVLISQGVRKEADAFGKYELKDGYVVEIEDGSLMLAPPISLGF